MSELREAIARAMQESKAWPVVFESGSAYTLADAALAAIEARGMVVVPKDPNAAMAGAGATRLGEFVQRRDSGVDIADAAYRAMIAAARTEG